ncbi:MjaI family restriction endonuclease [Natronogracilivirga saccharolytica]|uniref:MjaI family restriction endonuclease n=1 Tax=Natronogracilivirga saccharolytica TaxID=2812953 RepID=A0A8J7UY37_9BACT|nr:MjaI family restriction endonuclease [Natronogracilivirga saccharolytica]MBP3194004.1 MjaI family restriction endonuclease [Natronogracilivirga saccharolytica]
MSQKFKIKYDEIQNIVVGEVPNYPKYATQILNLANQNAQGTRPKIVGQMSDLIQEFDGQTVEQWIEWYEERYPDARKNAADRVEDMIKKLKESIDKIDREMIDTWVKDLVLYKTFIGLRFQEAILRKVADIKGTTYRLAGKDDESKGIDGYVGFMPVSIKPTTYRSKSSLAEDIKVEIIYYEKKKDGITVYFDF